MRDKYKRNSEADTWVPLLLNVHAHTHIAHICTHITHRGSCLLYRKWSFSLIVGSERFLFRWINQTPETNTLTPLTSTHEKTLVLRSEPRVMDSDNEEKGKPQCVVPSFKAPAVIWVGIWSVFVNLNPKSQMCSIVWPSTFISIDRKLKNISAKHCSSLSHAILLVFSVLFSSVS